jgi:hypothetical protein
MNFTYCVAIGDPSVMRDQVGVGANIEANTRRPARHRIQADVGNRVVLAQQILARRQVLVDKGEAGPQPLAENVLRSLVQCRVKQWAKTSLVNLAGEKIQPSLKSRPLDGSVRWNELSRRIAVRDVLGDRGGLKKYAAIIEHQSWYVAQRVYGIVVLTIRDLLAGFINP